MQISIEYDTQVYQTQPMGGPFVISLVRVPEQEGQGKGKGKGKGKQKMPSAMIGLIVAPIPDQSGTGYPPSKQMETFSGP
jgi:hypothetical protein